MAFLREEIKAGIIVISALILLSLFIVFIGGRQIFQDVDAYYVRVKNSAGLEQGSRVRLGGVSVGQVLDIQEPSGPGESTLITIGLRKGVDLYKGTRAVITQIGFVGDIYLLLAIDETYDEKFNAGDTIPSVEGADFTMLMAKVDLMAESLQELIQDVDKLFSDSNIDNIQKAVQNTEEILKEIGGLVRDAKTDVSKLIAKAIADLEKADEMILAIKDSARAIERAAEETGNTATSFGKTSLTIEDSVALQSRNISGLLTALTEATEDMQDLLRELRSRPWSIIYREGKTNDE